MDPPNAGGLRKFAISVKGGQLIYLWRFLLLVIIALIAWRMVMFGVSSHYVERLEGGDEAAAAKALAWNGRQPVALLRSALSLFERDPASAESLLARAYAENPGQAEPLLALAGIAEARGDMQRADSLVEFAVKLGPADASILNRVGAYWASRDRPEAAMQYWSRALEANASARKDLFPLLLRVAEAPGARSAFAPLALSPPSWWDSFFEMVSREALDVETVRAIFTMRREAPRAPLTEKERAAFVERLTKAGLADEAYLVWINGLSASDRKHLGLVFNGGFELEPSNRGFDWRIRETGSDRVNRAATFGVDGEKALHLLFNRREAPFGHVAQTLFLESGAYRVTGRVRTDGLKTKGGLEWVVRCLLPEAETLGASERFLGSSEWRTFSFELQVAETCMLQEIRIQSVGRNSYEHKIAGEVWFDGLSIRKLQESSVAVQQRPSDRRGFDEATTMEADVRETESAEPMDSSEIPESVGLQDAGGRLPSQAEDAATAAGGDNR